MSVELEAAQTPEDILNQAVALREGAGLYLDFVDSEARIRYVARLYAARARTASKGERPWDKVRISKVGAVTLRIDLERKPRHRNEFPRSVIMGTIV